MDEYAICPAILKSQRKPIEARIFGVPLGRIHIVHSKNNLFPKPLIEQHENGSIEKFEFVIPQNVKDFRLCCERIAKELGIVLQEPEYFSVQSHVRALIALQIKEV